MRGFAINVLLLATFVLSVLTPDWKTQLMAQAGCSPMDIARNGGNFGYCTPSLDGNYKGSGISEKLSQ